MKWNKHWLLPLNVLLVLALYNSSICSKEALLAKGKPVYLRLAPVDPRSLMQGDYMRLSFAIVDSMHKNDIPKRGFCVVTLDSVGLVTRVRWQEKSSPVQPGEQLLRYTTGNSGIQLGAESYFFQEGKASKYNTARYGMLKVDAAGNTLLVGLCDSSLRRL
ncbi:MAG: GDYXXLXY domain-containing protein [Sediminibacterium sp.]|nr:GDYXXLXY domain-containing protein [Sediminibacterium sp.]